MMSHILAGYGTIRTTTQKPITGHQQALAALAEAEKGAKLQAAKSQAIKDLWAESRKRVAGRCS